MPLKTDSDPVSSGTPHLAYKGSEVLEVLQEARNYNRYLHEAVLQHAAGARRVLDYGAGIGTFAQALKNEGLEVVCVEPDARQRLSLEGLGLESHASLAEIAPGSIEYAYSLNVLEHIEDDRAALAELFTTLQPGGRLFLYVPAFNKLYSNFDRYIGHFRRYTKGMLLPLLKEVGFQVESARYVDSLGYFVSLAFKVMNGKETGPDRSALRAYDRVLFPLSRRLDATLGRVLGKNLLVSAIRP